MSTDIAGVTSFTPKENDGGPAFPSDSACDSWQCRKPSEGMSLRQWYMGKALESIDTLRMLDEAEDDAVDRVPAAIAKFARLVADAMIKEASK